MLKHRYYSFYDESWMKYRTQAISSGIQRETESRHPNVVGFLAVAKMEQTEFLSRKEKLHLKLRNNNK